MAFCSFCGRQLNDGEVCVCRQQAQTPQTPQPQQVQQTVQQQQTQYQQAYQQAPYQQTQYQQAYQQDGGFSPTMPPVKKKGVIFAIIGAVAAVAIIAAVIFIVMLNRPKTKLYRSVTNTFEDCGDFFKTLSKADIAGKSMTIEASGEYQNYNATLKFAYDGKEKELSAKISGKKIDEVEAVVQLVKDELKLAFPGSGYDKVIVYNYKDGDSDFLEDQMGSRSFEEMNLALDMIYEASPSGDSVKDAKKILKDWYNGLEIKKIDSKKKFKVDSEKRECDGYTIVITPENIVDLVNKYVDYLEKNYSDMLEKTGVDIDDLKENMDLDEIEENMEGNLEIACYLYGGKLAGMIFTMEDQDEEIRINFEGGSYRMQNMSIETVEDDEEKEILSISGKTNGTKETSKLTADGTVLEWSYDKSNGDFKMSANQSSYWGDYEMFSLKGTLEAKGSTLSVSVKDLSVDGSKVDLDDLTISVSGSAKFSKLKGKEFDLNSADEDDIKDELEELQDSLGDLMKLVNAF